MLCRERPGAPDEHPVHGAEEQQHQGDAAVVLRVVGTASGRRLLAAGCVVSAALLGTTLPALATWAVVLAILIVLAALETRERLRAG